MFHSIKKPKIKNTELYKRIYHNDIKHYSIKTDKDLFLAEILYQGYRSREIIDEAYQRFYTLQYDIFKHLNNYEKRKLYQTDIKETLQSLPSFTYEDTEIYIPFYEPRINDWYSKDHFILDLTQHKDYIQNLKISLDESIKLYPDIFKTDFSSLEYIQDNYYYSKDFLTLYKIQDNQFINELTCPNQLELDIIKKIIPMIEDNHMKNVYNLLLENNIINQKQYKKLLK